MAGLIARLLEGLDLGDLHVFRFLRDLQGRYAGRAAFDEIGDADDLLLPAIELSLLIE